MENTKVKIKTSESEVNYFHYNFGHGTTAKFMQPNVPFIMEVVKGSKVKIKTSCIRRIDPMPLPPMSTVKFNTRFYFVPMVDICPYFKEFETQTPYGFRYGDGSDIVSRIPLNVPQVKMREVIKLLFGTLKTDTSVPLQNYVSGSSDYLEVVAGKLNNDLNSLPTNGFDIRLYLYQNSNSTNIGQVLFKFTDRGRNFFKLYKQLGYDFTVAGAKLGTNGIYLNDYVNTAFSALPLLAFAKVILSYYENSAFVDNSTRLAQMLSLLHCDYDGYELTASDLDIITDMTLVMTYERDYFTTSFINPNGGNNFIVNSESIDIPDPTLENRQHVITETLNGTPVFRKINNISSANVNNINNISATGIKLLQRLSMFMKKYQIVGGRMVDRMLAEFGVSTSDGYSRRTSYIDGIQSVMTISPVLNTTSEQLGDYAGYGQSGIDGDKNAPIEINSDENSGFIVAIDTIVPEIFYSQGYNRNNRHITKFDYLTPAFDAVSVQSTEVGEIYCTKQGIYNYIDDGAPSVIRFGYKPRYAEYKERVSYLTGDFICDSVNTDTDGYFTDRRFKMENYLNDDDEIDIHFSRSFATTYDNKQYNRIFYGSKNYTDYIKSVFRFDVEMYAPMKALYDEYRLEDETGNKDVTMEVGGQTMT